MRAKLVAHTPCALKSCAKKPNQLKALPPLTTQTHTHTQTQSNQIASAELGNGKTKAASIYNSNSNSSSSILRFASNSFQLALAAD